MRFSIFSTLSVLVAVLGFSEALISQISEPVKPILLKQPATKPGKDADKTGIYGEVSIKVTVSRTGKVLSAEFLEGPGWTCPEVTNQAITSFRSAARDAATKATFSAAMLNNEKVESEAILKYLFQPVKASPAAGLSIGGESEGARLFMVEDPAKGEDASKEQSNKDSQGVLNGKALKLSKPTYPAAAKAVRASGSGSNAGHY